MKITAKLLLSMSIILIGYLATTAISFYLGALNEQYLTFTAHELLPAVIKAQNATDAFDRQKKAYESAFLYGESNYLNTARLQQAEVQTLLQAISTRKAIAASQRKKIETFLARYDQWGKRAQAVYAVAAQGLFEVDDAMEAEMKSLSATQQQLTAMLSSISDDLRQTLIDGNTRIIQKTRLQRYSGLILFIVLSLITSIIVYTVIRRIVGPIQELAKVSNDLAMGNLEERVSIQNKDETGELAKAFNIMAQQLQETLEKVKAEVREKEKAEQEVRKINEELEKRVRERTRELEEAQKELVENAHKAGMADIAAGTLHNIGNILNSVQVSAEIINENVTRAPIDSMIRAGDLIREYRESLEDFVAHNDKAPKLLEYFLKLEELFIENYDEIQTNALRLESKIHIIGDVIAAQQSYAGAASFNEKLDLRVIVDDALTIHASSLEKYGIEVVKDYQEIPPIYIQKSKFLHVLINLIKNAKEAMFDQEGHRLLRLSVKSQDKTIVVTISDTGEGIAAQYMDKIFTHGFTTKTKGHGFGLHSSGNYMMEMKGTIDVASAGRGKGATFILTLPMATEQPA